MRKIKDVLRLRFGSQLSIRQVAAAVKLSTGATQSLIKRAEQLGLGWPLPEGLTDVDLEQRLYPQRQGAQGRFQMPDWRVVHQELKRKGMTLQLLWEEYCQAHAGRNYSYSQYTERYRQWCKKQKRSMRQTHRAGEKVFVDYAGPTIPIVDPRTGEIHIEACVFVGVLGASNFTFAEATRSQSLADWLQSHVNMFQFFGGIPESVVPDNLKSGVTKACRYDPDINPSYQQLAAHYDVAILPARPYKPKDKSKAVVGVQIVERWIMMRLRHLTFFSIAELNQCISTLLDELNTRAFKQLPGNRREAFDKLDRPALRPLPRQAYQYVDIKRVKVNIDYHVQYQSHHYSVPHQYVGEHLELHATDSLVQMYFRGKLIASQVKSSGYGTTTDPSHMPERHEKHQKWTPQRLLKWAGDIGPDTHLWIDTQLKSRAHPEQAYRVCLGLLSLSRDYPSCRLNKACQLANREGLVRLKNIKSILKSNRDQIGPFEGLSFTDRLELLLDQEQTLRENRKHDRLIKQAHFKISASINKIDYHQKRQLKKDHVAQLAQCEWIERHQNLLITGACGCGKTYLACAVGHAACLRGMRVRYYRLSRLLLALTQAKADGSYAKLLKQLASLDLLIIDDWGLEPLQQAHRNDLLEIFDDRHNNRSTIVLSQLATDQWYASIGDNTLADAILDRLMHNAHRINLKGASMREVLGQLTDGEHLG